MEAFHLCVYGIHHNPDLVGVRNLVPESVPLQASVKESIMLLIMLSSVLETFFCIYKVSEICLESMKMTPTCVDIVEQGYQTIFSTVTICALFRCSHFLQH